MRRIFYGPPEPPVRPQVTHDYDPKFCIRCREQPRWRKAVFCARCITEVCCNWVPWKCVHRQKAEEEEEND